MERSIEPAHQGDRGTDAEIRQSAGLHRLWVPLTLVWLSTLIDPVLDLVRDHRPVPIIAAGLIGMALFIGLDLWMGAHNLIKRPPDLPGSWRVWAPPVGIGAMAAALVLGFGQDWINVFVFAAGAIGVYLPSRLAIRALAVLLLLLIPVGTAVQLSLSDIGGYLLLCGAIGVTMVSLTGVGVANRELNRARTELARLAVTEERLRFARDLHDLIGHNLSLITLKSELAGRLITVSPEQAADEIRDIEAVARTALREVREAVAGYRQPSLDEEMHGAREILAAAGIALTVQRTTIELPAPTEATLAWIIREGVTNVIRHSRAHHCTIAIGAQDGGVAVEISDDGLGLPSGVAGSGLTGIAERTGALGGRFAAGPRTGGGFQVTAWLPLGENTPAVAMTPVRRTEFASAGPEMRPR